MPTGLIATDDAGQYIVRVLDAATATNSPPSSYAAAGVDISAILDNIYGKKGWPSHCGVVVRTTAGSGTLTATLKLWIGYRYSTSAGEYVAASPGTSTLAGVLNGGAAFDEHATDIIHRADVVQYPRLGRKHYVEVTAIGGTGTAVTVDYIFPAVIS